jgi:hypothetical protein
VSEWCVDGCADEDMVPDMPIQVSPDWIGQGEICKRCGFQTMKAEYYTPVERKCEQCDAMFWGMPEPEYDRICDDCFKVNLDAWAAKGFPSVDS